MRLVVTGGGTGGHVYPALEVARLGKERGAELLYLGSLRGQEGKLCDERGILFKGFPSEPLFSLRSARGWKSLSKLMSARKMAKRHLATARPDVVFSTGGYSAGPVLAAAKALGIPYVIHDGNSVPGRANRMFGKDAKAFLATFFATERFYKERPVTRTGHPIRKQLREAAEGARPKESGRLTILVLGGSQGSAYLNEAVPTAISAVEVDANVIHAAGPTNFAETSARVKGLGLENYRVEPYLVSEQIADAYREADLVVCRSGSTLAELAVFGLPSVLVPLPTSSENHQLHNAREFEAMEAATISEQESAPFTRTARQIV
ncbi:MAG TPA: UDP-N-acetylglucosamine--N-acetylmuramyl-(pentapeptide) pyrophosphoryl-undecaprenol N-acetylglucosamine transferase, partial [Fimbriimonadaceae bacterium]|nr:UDP-N-acetylglucosamine--N-acetylmuramyl-(pentapeptide) pyrophosphoryl-undecaprenol N-acetylglucosamine transferase [Fimbriimonadaceae bacterium]